MAEPAGIYRIQRHSGLKGGSNYYHHADVKASNWETALKAAKEGRVMNWRWIDAFDKSDKDYERFEYMRAVDVHEAEWPEWPGS